MDAPAESSQSVIMEGGAISGELRASVPFLGFVSLASWLMIRMGRSGLELLEFGHRLFPSDSRLEPLGAESILFNVLVPAAVIVFLAVLALRPAIRAATASYVLTSSRLTVRSAANESERVLLVPEIERAFVTQEALGRLLGYGDVTVVCVSGTTVRLQRIAHPSRWAKAICGASTSARGVHA